MPIADHDIRPRLDPMVPTTIVFVLSIGLKALLEGYSSNLSEEIVDLLTKSDALFTTPAVVVFRISEGIVVKKKPKKPQKTMPQPTTSLSRIFNSICLRSPPPGHTA